MCWRLSESKIIHVHGVFCILIDAFLISTLVGWKEVRMEDTCNLSSDASRAWLRVGTFQFRRSARSTSLIDAAFRF